MRPTTKLNAAPARTMQTRGNNATAHPGLCDLEDSDVGGANVAPQKRKRAPPMTKEQKEAKREKTEVAVRKMSRFEAQMVSKAAQDLHTPQHLSQHTSTQRTGSYVAPDPEPMSELTDLGLFDHETPSEAPTALEVSESDHDSERKTKKKKKSKNTPKKAGLRDSIAAYGATHLHGSDEDMVGPRPA